MTSLSIAISLLMAASERAGAAKAAVLKTDKKDRAKAWAIYYAHYTKARGIKEWILLDHKTIDLDDYLHQRLEKAREKHDRRR